MKTITYKGKIHTHYVGENDNALFVGETKQPFAKEFECKFNRRQLSVRYWISDKEKTKDQLQENMVKSLVGAVDADYADRYSELTGYLWTDQVLEVGGHDLLKELFSYMGKFIYLEIDIH